MDGKDLRGKLDAARCGWGSDERVAAMWQYHSQSQVTSDEWQKGVEGGKAMWMGEGMRGCQGRDLVEPAGLGVARWVMLLTQKPNSSLFFPHPRRSPLIMELLPSPSARTDQCALAWVWACSGHQPPAFAACDSPTGWKCGLQTYVICRRRAD